MSGHSVRLVLARANAGLHPLAWVKGAIAAGLMAVSPAFAQEAAPEGAAAEHDTGIPRYPLEKPERLDDWTFAGLFGRYDAEQLQRGLQVYRQVCSACHGRR